VKLFLGILTLSHVVFKEVIASMDDFIVLLIYNLVIILFLLHFILILEIMEMISSSEKKTNL